VENRTIAKTQRRRLSLAQAAEIQALMAAGSSWLTPADYADVFKKTSPNGDIVRYRTVVCALVRRLTGVSYGAIATSTGFSSKMVEAAVQRMPQLLAESVEARRMAAVLGSQFHVQFPTEWPSCGIVQVDDSPAARRRAEREAAQYLSSRAISLAQNLHRYLVMQSGMTAKALQQSRKSRHMMYRRLVVALVLRVPNLPIADACTVLGDLVAPRWTDVKVEAWATEAVYASNRLRQTAAKACDLYGLAWPDDWPVRPVEHRTVAASRSETSEQEYLRHQQKQHERVLTCFQLVSQAAGRPVDGLSLTGLLDALTPSYRHLAIGLVVEDNVLTALELRQLLGFKATRVVIRSCEAVPGHLARSVALGRVANQVAQQLGMDVPTAWQRSIWQAQNTIDRLWQIFDEFGQDVGLTGRELAGIQTRHGKLNQRCRLAAAVASCLPGLNDAAVNREIGRSVSYTVSALQDMPDYLAHSAELRWLVQAVAERHALELPGDWPLAA
jgi:hypothetical protein